MPCLTLGIIDPELTTDCFCGGRGFDTPILLARKKDSKRNSFDIIQAITLTLNHLRFLTIAKPMNPDQFPYRPKY